jgi:cytidylate kinase
MTTMSRPAEREDLADTTQGSAPRHGYRGRGAFARPDVPTALSITVSREAGARGGSIARRVGEKLGWQVYDQELLEYMAQNPVARQDTIEALPAAVAGWTARRLEELERLYGLRRHADVLHLAEVVLALAAAGQVVLIGRGSGCILPAGTTLNVRAVAPLPDRVAYMGQWLRLAQPEAAECVRQRDERRAEFLKRHFGRHPGEVHQYDLVLNSSLLGEEACAELIVQAARLRGAA